MFIFLNLISFRLKILGGVRHLGSDHKWMLTIELPVPEYTTLSNFSTIVHSLAELLTI